MLVIVEFIGVVALTGYFPPLGACMMCLQYLFTNVRYLY